MINMSRPNPEELLEDSQELKLDFSWMGYSYQQKELASHQGTPLVYHKVPEGKNVLIHNQDSEIFHLWYNSANNLIRVGEGFLVGLPAFLLLWNSICKAKKGLLSPSHYIYV